MPLNMNDPEGMSLQAGNLMVKPKFSTDVANYGNNVGKKNDQISINQPFDEMQL